MGARATSRRIAWHAGGSLALVIVLCCLPLIAAAFPVGRALLALFVPGVALVFFVAGAASRVARWMRAPVPFRIPVTTGQQASLSWLPRSRLGSPRAAWEAVARVVVDALLFRPLLRTASTRPGGGAASGPWLWLMAALFHGSLAAVAVRHLRLLLPEPPLWLTTVASLDAWLELGMPRVHLTGVSLLVGVSLLLLRRLLVARVRYVSLAADYFPLVLIGAIAVSGIYMRHFARSDVLALKSLLRSVAAFVPVVPAEIDPTLLVHLFLVSVLVAYFPLSKLMHFPGAIMSPTLGLANLGREARHENPWNPTVEVLSYSAYEAAFREHMREAGLPVTEE